VLSVCCGMNPGFE